MHRFITAVIENQRIYNIQIFKINAYFLLIEQYFFRIQACICISTRFYYVLGNFNGSFQIVTGKQKS